MKQVTPNSMRMHVVILGDTNTGKSTLFNAMIGQENAIVSPVKGTTTDPVNKAMELLPFGPIVLIDTAGLNDIGELGLKRMAKTNNAIRRATAAIYTADINEFSKENYWRFLKTTMPHILVFTKCETADNVKITELKSRYKKAFFWNKNDNNQLKDLHAILSDLLTSLEEKEKPLISDLVQKGSTVLLIMPIDSEAPKGRIILPQVQVLRDCLDNGIFSIVITEKELESAVNKFCNIALVVTDSQVFEFVNSVLPTSIPLTSFSMLYARQKGDFSQLLAGIEVIPFLKDGSKVLILEGCTHNCNHEDIGRVKIPALLRKKTGRDFIIDIKSGYDFPSEVIGDYDFVIQCGGCMLNRKEIKNRLNVLAENHIPVTNYGVLLAWGADMLARSIEIFS